jgi:cation diffusion facilitator family transporter
MNLAIKYGIISFIIILFQSILKLIAVIVTGSLALLSETIDTLVDIFFAGLTLYSLYLSEKPPDFEHMYGHGKIDSIGAVIQGIILSVIYFLLIFNSIQVFLNRTYQVTNPNSGILLIFISFIVNIIYSRILIWQGKKQKSLSLKVQGLNLFQDSLRSVIVLGSLFLATFGFTFLDPLFGIFLSIFIIFSSVKLTKEGIEELTDTNPLNNMIMRELREFINKISHVNGVEQIKVRTSGKKLFLDIILLVEDHISMAHADKITKSIKSITKKLFPPYEVELVIQMNPKSGEQTLGQKMINLIQSIRVDYPDILKIKDINLFEFQGNRFISMTMIVNQNLTLTEAHDMCTEFEDEVKNQVKELSRIITHIESEKKTENIIEISCKGINENKIRLVQNNIEQILKQFDNVKGYHGLECWDALNHCIIELHIFFEGGLNINTVHEDIEVIKQKIENLNIENLENIYLHSEPVEGRTDGKLF